MALTPRQRQARRLWMARALGLGYESTASTLALSLFFTSATAASGTVTDTEGTGNTLTFTRASVAKYWDADGVLQEAASGIARVGASNRKPVTNLLSYPEQFDNAVWTNSNTSESSGQSDPFGGTNAFKLVEANTAAGSTHYIEATTGITVQAKAYTHSVYAKAGERTWLRLGFATAAGVGFFNLSTGAVGTTSGLDGYGIAPVEGATGWYRCWITDTLAAGTDKPRITIAEADNDVAYDGDGSSGLYIFGAQLNEGGIEDYIGATNLLTDDKAFGSWTANSNTTVTSNSIAAPDGTTTADTVGDDSGTGTGAVNVAKAVTLPSAGTYTVSVFAKQKQLSWVKLQAISFTSPANGGVWFDLANGAVGAANTGYTGSITYWGNGWYLCSMEFTVTSDLVGNIQVNVCDADNDVTVDLDGTSDIYIWGVQLTKGSTLYPYVGMPQTGFTKQGYLAEAAATNLVTDSEDFSAAAWTNQNTTETVNQASAPDGTTTADLIQTTALTDEFSIFDNCVSGVSGVNHVGSVFLKAGTHRYASVLIMVDGTAAGWVVATVDLLSGTITKTGNGISGTPVGSGVIPVGDGWYRVWVSGSITSATNLYLQVVINSGSNPTYGSFGYETWTAAGTENILAWGAQLETGTYPSSYIRTSGGTATRAADDDNLIDALFGVNAGTLVYEGTPANSVTAATDRVSLNDGTANEVVKFVDDASGNIDFDVTDGGASQASIDTGLNAGVGQRRRVAGAFAANDFAASVNGLTAVTDAAGTVPTLTRMDLGRGYHKSVLFYSERKSDADLATLSTITDDGTTWRNGLA